MDASSRIAALATPEPIDSPRSAGAAARLAAAGGLASLFGAALGARGGGSAIGLHAAMAPVVVLGGFVVGALPLYVLLALADAPVELGGLARALSRGAVATSLILAGLSPLVLLFAVSGETWVAGAVLGWMSLVFALVTGLGAVRRDLAVGAPGAGVGAAVIVFAAFAVTLAMRLAWVSLPALGRGGAS